MSAVKAGYTLSVVNEGACMLVASKLARECKPGDCLLLTGTLGAGKTTFARGFIQALCGAAMEVCSPTFTLAQQYALPEGAGMVWHFDLYRLKHEQELEELGLEDALKDGIALVEWPDIAARHFPDTALTVALSVGNGSARTITFSGAADRWEQTLQKVCA